MTKPITVPAFIAIEWDKEGEPSRFKPIKTCTRADIDAHIIGLRRKVKARQADIKNLQAYPAGDELILGRQE